MARIAMKSDQLPPADWHLEVHGHLLSARTIADLRTTRILVC